MELVKMSLVFDTHIVNSLIEYTCILRVG